MTTPEIQAMIAQFQANAASLQAILDARVAAVSAPSTLQATARKVHNDQGDAASFTTWSAEETAHGSDGTLWTQPEHAYWLRLSKNALLAGVVDPVIG